MGKKKPTKDTWEQTLLELAKELREQLRDINDKLDHLIKTVKDQFLYYRHSNGLPHHSGHFR